jgi:hypothetical protein
MVRDRPEALAEPGGREKNIDGEVLHNWRRLTESGKHCK